MIVEDQSEIEELLSRPATFGQDKGEIRHVLTHISHVFIGKTQVFKLKRAVRFPYLDFSTAAIRRRFCEAEVEINRRTAPDLYLGVMAVTREADGSLTLDGKGEPVDWVVAMRRFDEETLFDRMAVRGELDKGLMDALAEAIADFHALAEIRPDAGGLKGLKHQADGNRTAFAHCPDGIFDKAKLAELFQASEAWLNKTATLLEQRREQGQVRHCHGDLHLRNICLMDGRPVLFDAIEFEEAFADIDILFDLAFLLMDLDHRDLRRLACFVMNSYLDLTGDVGGLAALPLFLSVRAAIRAHVTAATSGSVEVEAREYLDLAISYLTPPPPRLLAVGGLSGSGKSRLGRELAPFIGAAPGARVVRTDVIRKRLAGVRPLTRLGPDGYTAEMTERTYSAFMDELEQVLKSGHGAVADAVFAKPEQRDAVEELAKRMGTPFTGVWLEAPPEVMKARASGRKANASDAGAAVVDMQLDYDLGAMRWQRVDSSGTREETLVKGLSVLQGSKRP